MIGGGRGNGTCGLFPGRWRPPWCQIEGIGWAGRLLRRLAMELSPATRGDGEVSVIYIYILLSRKKQYEDK